LSLKHKKAYKKKSSHTYGWTSFCMPFYASNQWNKR
jgi:hypothetical protein